MAAAASAMSSRKSNTSASTFVYSHKRAVSAFVDLVMRSALPLNLGESPSFVLFLKSCNPNSRKIEEKTLLLEIEKEFVRLKKELHPTLASLTRKISLVCDVWYNEKQSGFIRVIANWIDTDWVMQRRVISFRESEFPEYGPYTLERVVEPLREWGIDDKVFSVVFDEVSGEPEVIEGVRNVVNPVLDGRVFHGRCVCRDLISCIQEVWKDMHPIVNKIRCGVSCSGETHYVDFGVFCEKYGLEPGKLVFDDDYHWDTTLDMMKSCLPYKDALNEFITEHWAAAEAEKDSDDEFYNGACLEKDLMTEQEWDIASVFCSVLDVFHEAITDISSTYKPSSSGILLHLVNVAKMFSECRENDAFKQKLSVMEKTFLTNFNKIPELYCLAAVMDPRIKLSGCECLLESFYQCTGNTKVNIDEEKQEVSNLLQEMYNLYVSQSKSHFPSSGTTANVGSNSFAWSVLSHKKQKIEDSAISELTSYLGLPLEVGSQNGTKEFDILRWWKAHEIVYPILSTMARDLLTISASSLKPECAFVLNKEKRILEKTPYHLEGKTLEIYTCLRDWYRAETRTQGERKEIELGPRFYSVGQRRLNFLLGDSDD